MSKRQRLYFRPDDGLAREEVVRQTVDAFLEFFIEQAEARGDHAAAEKLRAGLAKKPRGDESATKDGYRVSGRQPRNPILWSRFMHHPYLKGV